MNLSESDRLEVLLERAVEALERIAEALEAIDRTGIDTYEQNE